MKEDIWKEAEKNIVIRGEEMNVVESCVDRHAEENGDKAAFVFENDFGERTTYTYSQLEEEINKFANLLKTKKIKKNSRVFIFLPKVPEMYISILGTIKAGCIAAPMFEAFQTDGVMLRLERGEANVLVTNKELMERIPSEIRGKVKSLKEIFIIDSKEYKKEFEKQEKKFDVVLRKKEDTAVMIFTSSTAGTPVAGIEIPHYGLVQQDFTARLVLDLNEEDKYWCTAHPAWVTGTIYGILAPLSVGCTNYVISGRFDSGKWIKFIKKNNISVIYTAPTALKLLKPEIDKIDLAGVKNICSVGEALPQSLFDFYASLGLQINDTYWQTETGAMVIANWPDLEKKKGSLGKVLPGIEASIKDGIIVIKPGWPAMMTGIYKHKKMYNSYFKEGLFRTNDAARLDSEGYFFFEGRKDDIIKTSGERVSPLEVENVLLKHKAVKEAAVIGIPDPVRGEIIKAFIVLNVGFKEDEKLKEDLKNFVKEGYAAHAYPREIEFTNELPKNNAGKIVRMELKEREAKKAGK